MISVLSQPASPALSGNPMVVTIGCTDNSGNALQWRGVYARMLPIGYNRLVAGQYFQVVYTEPSGLTVSVYFTASNTPDAAITSVPASGVSYPSGQSYWTAVAEKIQAHPQINSRLKVFAEDLGSSMALVVEAGDLDPDWLVNISEENTANVTIDQEIIPTSTVPDNYRVYVDVFLEESLGSGLYTKVGTVDDTPNSDSQVRFDISNLLHASIEDLLPDLKVPVWEAVDPQPLRTKRNYYLRIYELKTSGGLGFDDIIMQDPAAVILGGIGQNVFADNNDFFDSLDEDNCFLSWKGLQRTVDETQPEWMPYYNHTLVPVGIALQVREYGADATLILTRILFTYGPGEDEVPYFEVAPGEIVLLPIGVRQLGVSTAAAYYTVQMIDYDDYNDPPDEFVPQTNPIAPLIRVDVDREYYEEVRYLQYLNAFFAPELQRCTGDYSKSLDSEPEDAQRTLVPGFPSTIAAKYTYQTNWNNRFSYQTGYLSAAEMEYLQELYIYRKAYEISEAGYIPLLILGKGMSINSTRQNLRSQLIEAEPALASVYYSGERMVTPEPEIPDNALVPGPFYDHAAAFAAGVAKNEPYIILVDNPYGYPSPNSSGVVAQVQFGTTGPNSIAGPYLGHSQAYAAGVAKNEPYIIMAENIYGHPSPGSMSIVAQIQFGSLGLNSISGTYADNPAAIAGSLMEGEMYRVTQNNQIGFPSLNGMGILAVTD